MSNIPPKKLVEYTAAELEAELTSEGLSARKLTDEQKKRNRKAALIMIYQNKEVLNYLVAVRDELKEGILELSHPRKRGLFIKDVDGFHAKIDFITKLINHAEALWKSRFKKSLTNQT